MWAIWSFVKLCYAFAFAMQIMIYSMYLHTKLKSLNANIRDLFPILENGEDSSGEHCFVGCLCSSMGVSYYFSHTCISTPL